VKAMRKKSSLGNPSRLKPTDDKNKMLRVVVETPKGSRNKFAFEPKSLSQAERREVSGDRPQGREGRSGSHEVVETVKDAKVVRQRKGKNPPGRILSHFLRECGCSLRIGPPREMLD